MKTNTKQLAIYLPFRLNGVDSSNKKYMYRGVNDSGGECWDCETELKEKSHGVKPLMRSLNSLSKEINHNGEKFIPIKKLYSMLYGFTRAHLDIIECSLTCGIDEKEVSKAVLDYKGNYHYFSIKHSEVHEYSYEIVSKLVEWYFDINDLIAKGLAQEIND